MLCTISEFRVVSQFPFCALSGAPRLCGLSGFALLLPQSRGGPRRHAENVANSDTTEFWEESSLPPECDFCVKTSMNVRLDVTVSDVDKTQDIRSFSRTVRAPRAATASLNGVVVCAVSCGRQVGR